MIAILLKVAFVGSIVYGGFQLLSILWTDGKSPLFLWHGTKVLLPVLPYDSPGKAIWALAQTVFAIIALGFGARVFQALQTAATPFHTDVSARLKPFAVALLLVGVVGNSACLLAAGVTWVLYLIFNYGRALEEEKDQTCDTPT